MSISFPEGCSIYRVFFLPEKLWVSCFTYHGKSEITNSWWVLWWFQVFPPLPFLPIPSSNISIDSYCKCLLQSLSLSPSLHCPLFFSLFTPPCPLPLMSFNISVFMKTLCLMTIKLENNKFKSMNIFIKYNTSSLATAATKGKAQGKKAKKNQRK